MTAVLVAQSWRSNAELIEALATRLGYLHLEHATLDPTYGRGTWWKRWKPLDLVRHDLKLNGVDFRHLPHPAGSFRQVVFDPPYVCPGGRRTTGTPEFHDRYGMGDSPRTPAELQAMNDAGLAECVRVLAPRGVLLVKAANYVSSGRLWPGAHLTWAKAMSLGLEQVDELHHLGRPRQQPARTRKDGQPVRQHHARSNTSVLYVFRRPGRAR